MTLAQVEYTEQRMQQQWHDLVVAEQVGKPPEILEQMYDVYIHLAEEFNVIFLKSRLSGSGAPDPDK